MQVELYTKFDDNLKDIWLNLESKGYLTPFQSYTWLSRWYNIVGLKDKNIEPLIILVKEKNKPIVLFPFCKRKSNFIVLVEYIGGIHADYKAPIFAKEPKIDRQNFYILWKNVKAKLPHHDLLMLNDQPEKIGDLINPFVKYLRVKLKTTASHHNIEGDWNNFYNEKLKKRIRLDSKRCIRNLEKIGKLKFKVSKKITESVEIIEKMIQQKRKRYKETGLSDLLSQSENRDFYLSLPYVENSSINFHFSSLSINKIIIATHVGFIFNNCFYYLMPANEFGDWKKFSPGRLLLEKLFEQSFMEKNDVFDFTVGGESYKQYWCNQTIGIYNYNKAATIKGHLYSLIEIFKRKFIYTEFNINFIRKIRKYIHGLLKKNIEKF